MVRKCVGDRASLARGVFVAFPSSSSHPALSASWSATHGALEGSGGAPLSACDDDCYFSGGALKYIL